MNTRDPEIVYLRDHLRLSTAKVAMRLGITAPEVSALYIKARVRMHAQATDSSAPYGGLSRQARRLLWEARITDRKEARRAILAGKLVPNKMPFRYTKPLHAEVCKWAGLGSVKMTKAGVIMRLPEPHPTIQDPLPLDELAEKIKGARCAPELLLGHLVKHWNKMADSVIE